MTEAGLNRLCLEAELVELQPIRLTPAGIPVSGCALKHASKQVEAGVPRDVSMELQAVAIGELARMLAAAVPGMSVRVSGFLAARSQRSRSLVLHLDKIEFLEGTKNGFQVEVQVQEKG
ncbi:MAG: primosomal replication protein N [Thauera sp.]|nr:primosomal replication protein N [Thauera sp.]